MHLNAQSLLSSLDELILTMEKYPSDVITMTETWLAQRLQYATVPGYSPEFRHRNNLRDCGVGAYIRDSLEYKRRKYVENMEPDLEHLWIEFPSRNKYSKLLLGAVYRSEKALSFGDWLEKLLNNHLGRSYSRHRGYEY